MISPNLINNNYFFIGEKKSTRNRVSYRRAYKKQSSIDNKAINNY